MGVRYLLDTHVVLWLQADPERVPHDVRVKLADRENELYVSAVSALEVATKVRSGKLSAPGLVEAWHRRMSDVGAEPAPITAEHALLAGRMEWEHRDPFDRLLVAQATVEGFTLVTVDGSMRGLPSPRILTW